MGRKWGNQVVKRLQGWECLSEELFAPLEAFWGELVAVAG
jgi:hypothetical protein